MRIAEQQPRPLVVASEPNAHALLPIAALTISPRGRSGSAARAVRVAGGCAATMSSIGLCPPESVVTPVYQRY
ncbi:MAG TPA: hypothetical protein VE010_09830, partial [Thermoanaerobaculia bacterium]|nr:hypothetical protein [Thermoanaerobaculia bacterium]